ncbi:MAG: DUF4364 family protein [Clostridiales bacterium]|nr:DUF4364 family protein [Candidatus Equinaster intestinalis]
MEFDSASAGVSFGGLVSSSEIKILICYILNSVKEPVPATELCESLYYEGIANIFEISDNIKNLEKSGHIKMVNAEEESYTVTESGTEIANTLKSSVPISVRDKGCFVTQKMLARRRNIRETDIAITREDDKTFITCSAMEKDIAIISVKLLVSDETQAVAIRNNFLENPSEIYSKIIDLFTENK